MKTYQNYIWDLDGTLLDSYGAIVDALDAVMSRHGVPQEKDRILRAVKLGSVSGYLREMAERHGMDYGQLYREYREITHGNLETIGLIPGAMETLRGLRDRGCRHDVYTHRGASTAALLERLALNGFFSEVVTFERGFAPKPSGEAVRYLMEKYGMDPERTAYVGDREIDVLCAKDAGARAVLFLPEGTSVAPTGKEDRIIGRLEELLED